MVLTWSTLLLLSLIGFGLWLGKKARIRRFDPNLEDQQARIAKGRSRAVTRAEFERMQQGEHRP
jgi:cell division protein FtsB